MARMFCERQLLARTSQRRSARAGRVLCYHSIGQQNLGVNDVTAARFRNQIDWALAAGYRFVPARQIANTGGAPNELAITFDDAWASVASAALPILRDYGIPFSVFVVSSWADGDCADPGGVLDWRALERLLAAQVEIGSHSVTHSDFAQLDDGQISYELETSRARIAERLGVDVTSFAIPYGQSMNWPEPANAAAAKAGYEVIYAQAVETRPAGTIARTFVTKFDDRVIFEALLGGAFDRWEEWIFQ
jgi:peptidoglycan/xylan/chitin deacetylase (PgdA/CDA1 family)